MKINIAFKHLDHTPALDKRIREKTNRLEKYLDGNTTVEWTCSAKDSIHSAEVKFTAPHCQYYANAESESLYKTIDLAIAKIERQVEKKKEMWKEKIHHKHEKPLEYADPEDAWLEHEDEDEEEDKEEKEDESV
jgi:putative sigma-54 modulation protein